MAARRAVTPKRLVCIVEGEGDQAAINNLCSRILIKLGVHGWVVDDPIKQPRSKLVDQSQPSPTRSANKEGLGKAIELARRRPADAVLILCDADDDCPAVWARSAELAMRAWVAGGAVMATCEFEAWLLIAQVGSGNLGGRRIEDIRDAKGRLAKMVPGYKPTVDQLPLTRSLDIDVVWANSDSFDKLVRTLAKIAGIGPVKRPLVS